MKLMQKEEEVSTPLVFDVDEFDIWNRGIHEGIDRRLGERELSDEFRLKVESYLRNAIPVVFSNNLQCLLSSDSGSTGWASYSVKPVVNPVDMCCDLILAALEFEP